MSSRLESFQGNLGTIVVRVWDNPAARQVVLLVHGYGEHIGRYDHVAERLVATGATVWGADHIGHGRSDGQRALIADFEPVVDDLDHVVAMAREANPGLPIVVVGHSMGGMIATRYAQRFGQQLCGLVLSGPGLGLLPLAEMLLSLPEIPDIPIDPSVLSRDPAVGASYATDELVYHGPMQRPTLAAMRDMIVTIKTGGGFATLPTLWLHGSDDSLVPLPETRTVLEPLRGSDFTEHIYPDARHEIFNETNKAEVLDEVCAFIERVTQK